MSPFSKSQYRKMLDGLDANEVMWSAVRQRHFLPLGPDFHSKGRALALKKLSGTTDVSSQFDLVRETVTEINAPVVEYDLTDAISQFLEKEDSTSEIESAKKNAIPGDLVVSRLRSYLREIAVVPRRPIPQLFSSEFLVLRPIRGSVVSAQTMLALLLCPHAQTIFARSQYGTGHPRFYEFALTEMPIPASVLGINQAVTVQMKMAEKLREKSRTLFHAAELLLLRELGLTNWQPSRQAWAEKTLSESFGASGRIDAEYYSPILDEMRDTIRKQGIQFQSAGDVFSVYTDKVTPDQQRKYCYIELANVGSFGNILSHTRLLGADLPTRARQIVHAGNVIVPAVEGSISACALIGREHDGFLCSTGFFVLEPHNISPEMAFLLFKSRYLQEAMKHAASGTILTSVNSEMFSAIPVPIPSQKLQTRIQSDVKKAFAVRLQSERLMNAAVQAVECAVEKGEKAGLKMLEKLTA